MESGDARIKGTFIKLDRSIQQWRWYTNANTFRVFLHILLNANIRDCDFELITIHRGELAASYKKIGESLELTERQVRTALNHLKESGEVSITRYSKFLVISVLNYDFYQGKKVKESASRSIKSQSFVFQKSIKSQQSKNIKNIKNEKNIYTHAREEENLKDNAEDDCPFNFRVDVNQF